MLTSLMIFIHNHPFITGLLLFYASSQYVRRHGLYTPSQNRQEEDDEE